MLSEQQIDQEGWVITIDGDSAHAVKADGNEFSIHVHEREVQVGEDSDGNPVLELQKPDAYEEIITSISHYEQSRKV